VGIRMVAIRGLSLPIDRKLKKRIVKLAHRIRSKYSPNNHLTGNDFGKKQRGTTGKAAQGSASAAFKKRTEPE